MMHDHDQPKHINPYNLSFTNLPLAFSLFINKVIKLWKITNMHYVSLNNFSDFI
jgi:hypothetical protein